MKKESFEALKQMLIETYRKYGDEVVCNVMGHKSKKVPWTGNELADEVENETEWGLERMYSIMGLAVDLLKRDKIHKNDNK